MLLELRHQQQRRQLLLLLLQRLRAEGTLKPPAAAPAPAPPAAYSAPLQAPASLAADWDLLLPDDLCSMPTASLEDLLYP